ncbi:hypothetical protein N4G40_16330 [Pantoea eucrina]|uniref:Uncharacterized protein n=1 Tax=Pantoea eucrina TaxID=472693 RepID=A0ABU5LIR0_9GAMM|nr:hypothetical protein [Pantoea eucrina]MDZ7279824.1 hypothetical protein [Pantoea eucrina]
MQRTVVFIEFSGCARQSTPYNAPPSTRHNGLRNAVLTGRLDKNFRRRKALKKVFDSEGGKRNIRQPGIKQESPERAFRAFLRLQKIASTENDIRRKNSAENHACRKRCLKNGVWKKYTDTTFENTTLAIANPFPAALLFPTYAETFS